MTDKELTDAINGLIAYDMGCTDSGIHDERLKQRVIKELHSRGNSIAFLTQHVIDMLTCDQGYTIEDVNELIKWLKKEMNYDF